MSRTIIFGDIHGCIDEWKALLKKTGASSKDRLISVGDLVCKGPSTKDVLDLAMELDNLDCIMGNHELHLLLHWQENRLHDLHKEYQHRAIEELGSKIDKYMKFIRSWPYYLDLKECLVIHGGMRPGIPIHKQKEKELVSLRKLEPEDIAWYERYTEKKLVVYGHWARQGLNVRKNTIGLDSGCVYGNELSAVILPERKIVTVPAKKNYCPAGG